MTDSGLPSKGQNQKWKWVDYMAIVNQDATLPQEPDPLSQIHHYESLDSYTCLQSLISSAIYHFPVSIEAKLYLDNNLHSQVR